MVQVKVNEGILEGEAVINQYGGKFYSFKGIPYAQPPIGDLRFKAPKDVVPWNGVRLAKEFGPQCYQSGFIQGIAPTGSEDCLYLNVYTPDIKPNSSLPVMFWIHGGGFQTGNGNDDLYGPEFLVRHGVILVTINYRLNVIGFLSLGTADIPGNAGMKDQVAALKWVNKNIIHFGGDPNNITIFGESAGSASVSFHLVSPMTKGLFKRAITQSATNLCWASNLLEPINRARALAKQLGCLSNDNKQIYDFFKSQPIERLIDNQITLTFAEEAREGPTFTFGIVQENKFNDTGTFWCEDVNDVLRRGSVHEGVEIINGYTEDEGVLAFINSDFDKILSQANKFSEFLVPTPLAINLPITQQLEIGRKFKSFYFKNKDITKDNVEGLVRYFGFNLFVYSSIFWQKLYAAIGKNKTYLYKFTCKSERNLFRHILNVSHVLDKNPIVAHADDLPYIFPFKIAGMDIDMNSETFKMIEQVTKLWTNFAKYGDPTPDDSLGAKWTPYTLENQDYLEIGNQLISKTVPEQEEMEFWEGIFREYYPKLVLK